MDTTYAESPTKLLQGYDTFVGVIRSGALTLIDSSQSGGTSTSDVTICTDSQSVSDALDISASVSDKMFDASVSAKASWVDSLNVTSTSVVVLVHTVVSELLQATQYSLNAGITAPSSTSDVQAFFAAYGDSFVDAMVIGAEYYAAFIYDTTTTDDQQTVTASLKGHDGPLTANLSAAITTASSDVNMTVRISQQMLGESNLSYPTVSDDVDETVNNIVNFGMDFTGQAFSSISSPEILGVSYQGYEHAPGCSAFNPAVPQNRNLLGNGSAAPFVDALNTLVTLSSQVAAIQALYDAYGYTHDSNFAAQSAQVAQDLNTLSSLTQNIETNVTGTFPAPSLPSLDYGTPNVSYQLSPASNSLGIGNTKTAVGFYDLTPAQIAAGVVPRKIQTGLDAISVTYSDGTVHSHGIGLNASLNIEEGDSIASVTQGGVPNIGPAAIGATTASGKVLPLPTDAVAAEVLTAPPAIIGFCGQMSAASPNQMVALYPITIKFSPAVWVQSISS